MQSFLTSLSVMRRSKLEFQSGRQDLYQSRTLKARQLTASTLATTRFENRATVKSKNLYHQAPKIEKQSSWQQEEVQYVGSMVQSLTDALALETKQAMVRQHSNNKSLRHFYYMGLNRVIKYPHEEIPQFVMERFAQQKLNHSKPSFKQGYLKYAGCIYYAIENHLILVKSIDFLKKAEDPAHVVPYRIVEVRNRVSQVLQIKGKSLIFPSYQHIVVTVHPWEIQFWAWDTLKKDQPNNQGSYFQQGLKKLRIIYKIPFQEIKGIDYSKDGRLFFFDNAGALHQIYPKQQKNLFFHKTGRYSLKTKIDNSRNTFQLFLKKNGAFEIVKSISRNLDQLIKQFLPSEIETINIFCDRKRNLLFALLNKTTYTLFSMERKKFVVCYELLPSKIKLLHNFSQQSFYEKFGSHINSETAKTFKIHSIHQITRNQKIVGQANLCIVTKSSNRIFLCVNKNQCVFQQMVRAPNHRMFDTNSTRCAPLLHQFPPCDKSLYSTVLSFCDRDRNIMIVKTSPSFQKEERSKQTSNYKKIAYITFSPGICSGPLDQNQTIQKIPLEVCRSSEHSEISIDKVMESTVVTDFMQKNAIDHIDMQISSEELTDRNDCSSFQIQLESYQQTLLPPSFYLVRSDRCLQYLIYLRQVDIVFTAVWLKARKYCFYGNKQSYMFSYSSPYTYDNIKMDQFLTCIFIENSYLGDSSSSFSLGFNANLSLLGNPTKSSSITFSTEEERRVKRQDLCRMLFQIMADKQGKYCFSSQTAKQMLEMEKEALLYRMRKETTEDKFQRKGNYTQRSDYESIEKQKQLRKKMSTKTEMLWYLQKNKVIEFEEFSQQMLMQIRTTWERLIKNSDSSSTYVQIQPSNLLDKATVARSPKVQFHQKQKLEDLPQFKNKASIQIILQYLTRILHLVWEENIRQLSVQDHESLRYLLLRKVGFVRDFIKNSGYFVFQQNSLQKSMVGESKKDKRSYEYLDILLSKVQQLLNLIGILPILPKNMKFMECLKIGTVQEESQDALCECIFESIDRQFNPAIIHEWRSLFPHFISIETVRVVTLYGQIEKIDDRTNIVQAILKQDTVHYLPSFFMRYLKQKRGIQLKDIDKVVRDIEIQNRYENSKSFQKWSNKRFYRHKQVKNNQNTKSNSKDEANNIMPLSVSNILQAKCLKDLTERDIFNLFAQFSVSFAPSLELNPQIDTLFDFYFKNPQSKCSNKLSIQKKFFLIAHVQRKLKDILFHQEQNQKDKPKFLHQLATLIRCTQVQYQVYRFYIKLIEEYNGSISPWNKGERFSTIRKILDRINLFAKTRKTKENNLAGIKRIQENQETLHLLKYELLNKQEVLKELCWATDDLAVMSCYCSFFRDSDSFQRVFRDIYDGQEDKLQRDQQIYFKNYCMEISIKSSHDESILQTICSVFDSRKSEQISITTMVERWLSFYKLQKLSSDQIWLPQMLLQSGYSATTLYQVYRGQMHNAFDKMQCLQFQTLFCLKFLNSCIVVKAEGNNSLKKQFVHDMELYLNALKRNSSITSQIHIGIQKMLDQL